VRGEITGLVLITLLVTGCSSTGNLGIVTKSMADPGALITTAGHYQAIGPANGKACRYIILGILPLGDSTVTKAISNALETTGGDALVNVSVTSSLHTFVPIYNVFCITCTSVDGIAIKLDAATKPAT
jgi:hypothetical protein